MPNRPRPTTHMPMTVPPEKATWRAAGSPCRAAWVVRMLDAVATFIPKNPDRPEQNAPTTKDTATRRTGPLLPKARSAATTRTNTDRTLYSRERKAMAPSRTAAPISCIFSVPGSCL